MINLFEHNQKAYEYAVSLMAESGKAAVIHPTGTGKSFIGFKLCEDNPDKTICWLSPSEYIFKTQLENLSAVSGGYVPQNIKFFTYAKLMNLATDELAEIHPDYIILDEFHRCGAVEWGRGVDSLLELYEDVPVLGTSATNIRYLDNQRDMAYELFDGNIASEITLGEAIARGILPAPKYIMSVYSYQNEFERLQRRVRSVQGKAAKDAAEKYLEALRRALEKAEGLDAIFEKHMEEKHGKYIVFCASFQHMGEMIAEAKKWFCRVDTSPKIYTVYSADPASSKSFSNFKADTDSSHLRLLYCIDALNEGIHVNDIDGVIMVRPTISPIIYKQQIGRALSASQRKTPVIFDIVNNFENLYSISAIEEEMKAAVTYYNFTGDSGIVVNEEFTIIDEVRDCRRLFDQLADSLSANWEIMYAAAKRYYEENGHLVPEKKYKTAEGYALGAWVNTQRMVRRGNAKGALTEERIKKLDEIGMRWETRFDCVWNKNYSELLKYREIFGNIDVPYNYVTDGNVALGKWIVDLRVAYNSGIKKGVLTDERIEILNSLGMIWNKVDYIWEKNYFALLEYHRVNGNTDISKRYITEDGISLGSWLYNIKMRYSETNGKSLTESQKTRLEALGVDLTFRYGFEKEWDKYFEKAKEYYNKNGNLSMPRGYVTEDGISLGSWLSNIRSSKRLSEEMKKVLSEIGMCWEGNMSSLWDEYYPIVKQYFEEFGNINISTKTRYRNAYPGVWLVEKRKQYRNGTLPQNEKALLDALSMNWLTAKESMWEEMFSEASRYYEENGNLEVPKKNKKLNLWVASQRTKGRKGILDETQKERLSSIGMVWETDDLWEKHYEKAKEFYEANGNLDIPATYVTSDGVKLGNWYRYQLKSYREGLLTDEKAKQLEAIGIQKESVIHRNWMNNYQACKEYYEANGNLNISRSYIAENGVKLGIWVLSQRESYKQGRLTEEQINLLEAVGMQWNRFDEKWESFYQLAKDYYDINGNLDISSGYITQSGEKLGTWINAQRGKYKSSKLSRLQIEKLEAIGMVWSPNDADWERGYKYALEYYKTNRSLDVKSKFVTEDGFNLGMWLQNKRTAYKKGKLSAERIALLDKIGMKWGNKNSNKSVSRQNKGIGSISIQSFGNAPKDK